MAKWHISSEGKVERCRAFFRPCPLTNYDTEEEAQAVLDKKETKSLSKSRTPTRSLAERLHREDFPSAMLRYDTNDSMGIQHTINHFSRYTKMMGEKPLTHHVTFEVVDELGDKVTFTRSSSLNREHTKVIPQWYMKSVNNYSPKNRTLNIDGNYHEEMQSVLKETKDTFSYAKSSRRSIAEKERDGQRAAEMFASLVNAIDEREIGPYEMARKHPKRMTTFRKSVDSTIVDVNTMLQTSNLDGELLKDFLKQNPATSGGRIFDAQIRVWDNRHQGAGKDGWAMSYDNGYWNFEKGNVSEQGKSESKRVSSAQDMKNHVYNELISMGADKKEAKAKADYAFRMVNEINDAIDVSMDEKQSPVLAERIAEQKKKEYEDETRVKSAEEKLFFTSERKNPTPVRNRISSDPYAEQSYEEKLAELLHRG